MSAQPVAASAAAPSAQLIGKGPLSIALVGPDGVGKSSAIAELRRQVNEQLPQVAFEVRQWRPSLLPDLGVFLGKSSKPAAKTPPRREPGRFHLVRLVYYWLDFLIGSWWKDRVRAPAGGLIVYDRCALDMYVDPVRFALRSRFGTRLLWKLTPRPSLVVLLHDDPERIWDRKRELQRHEMAEQLDTWMELAESGDVHAVIRIDAGADEIAARLLSLIATRNQSCEPAALPMAVPVEPSRPPECKPLYRLNRFLIPLGPRRVAARSLDIYNPQARRARLAKSVLKAGLRTGLAQPFLRERAAELPFGELFGSYYAVSLGTPNRSQKPVVQVMNDHGQVLGYAKIGWNERTVQLVQNEARVLESLHDRTFSTALVPRVLQAKTWRDYYVLLESAPDAPLGCSPQRLDERHVRFLAELRQCHPACMRLPDESEKLDELWRMGFQYQAHLIERAGALCSQKVGGALAPAGFGHGDFTPWNIRLDGDKLLVLDWEYGGPSWPALWDLFHFEISAAIELRNQPAWLIYRAVRRTAREHCGRFEVAESWIDPLLISYVCDALSSNLLEHRHAPDRKDQIARTTLAGLLAILGRPGAHHA